MPPRLAKPVFRKNQALKDQLWDIAHNLAVHEVRMHHDEIQEWLTQLLTRQHFRALLRDFRNKTHYRLPHASQLNMFTMRTYTEEQA